MRPIDLRTTLRESTLDFAKQHGFEVDTSHKSAVIFKNIADAFLPESFGAIRQNPDWANRTTKPHQTISGAMEMQSSNSSDALLMNVFCHPKLVTWKGVTNILGFNPIEPKFGYNAYVEKEGTDGDSTEIDMVVGDFFIEAKLTEPDFTKKDIIEVTKYKQFDQSFHTECLPTQGDCYKNYQIIRNLLATIQHNKHHVLLCDERRPDLVRSYMETVSCLRDHLHRRKCKVVFWQEIQRACGDNLGSYLYSRYGLS